MFESILCYLILVANNRLLLLFSPQFFVGKFSMEMFDIGSQQMDLAVSLSILLKSSAESFDHLIIEQLPNSKFTVSMMMMMMMLDHNDLLKPQSLTIENYCN